MSSGDSKRVSHPSSRVGWKFLIPVVVFCGLLTWLGIKSFRELDPIIEPKPEMLDYPVTDVQRGKLSPKVLSFLERIEARDVSGRLEQEFAEVFSEADEVEESQTGEGTFSVWMGRHVNWKAIL